MATDEEVMASVKSYIMDTFLIGEDPDEVSPDTELVKSGILNSISLLKLSMFLEETYSITLDAPDMKELNSLQEISSLVSNKLSNG